MKKRVMVLGCGLVGATIAKDLAADEALDVTVADVSERNLDRVANVAGLRRACQDLGTPDAVKSIIQDCQLVIGAMPSALGYRTLGAVIESRKPYVDISFMAEDATALNGLAEEMGVTAVVDCGVAPGLANIVIGSCDAQLDRTEDVVFYVGGLPKERRWPYQYKAGFAPSDVLEEYTRPARMIENGRVVTKPALSEPELIDFEGVGTLEAFNTDGLRSLLTTVQATNMKEKTLRYAGHIELMRVLRETGLFRKDAMEVGGVRVRPLDLTSRLLFPLWELKPGDQEFTVLRVIVEGRRDGRRLRFTYDLYDETDPKTGNSSMARTTGFPCAIVGRLLLSGALKRPGVLPPELLGHEPGLLQRLTAELAHRGVVLREKVDELREAPASAERG